MIFAAESSQVDAAEQVAFGIVKGLRKVSTVTRTVKRFDESGAAGTTRERVPRALKHYGVAIVAVGIAFFARYFMSRVLGEELPFTLFIAAALVAAWYGGAATGIVALMLGLLLADYFFVGSARAFGAHDPNSWVRIVRYVFTASLGIGLIEVLHRARRRTESALRETQAEAARREKSEAKLLEAHDLLRERARELDRRIDERTAALRANVSSLHDILYNIAHCLRAPIRASTSYSHIFMEQYGLQLDATGKDYILRICQAAARMEALTQDLLQYGEVAQKSVTLDRLNLGGVVERAVARLRPRIEKLSADVSVEGELPEAWGQLTLAEQSIIELLDNAMKFGKAGVSPRIRICAERGESSVRLWISDNGIGIEPRYHNRIFGVFEQVQPTHYANGTGIGLAIVRKGMQRQRGDAGVESEPGVGSRFWLDFPAAATNEAEKLEATAAA
jgi:signal transduction histidine kinase